MTNTHRIQPLAVLFVLTFSTCKKDSATGSATIIGKWANTDYHQVAQYEFKNDSTFEMDVFARDSVTKNIIGYRYNSLGKFRRASSLLTLYGISNFLNPKSEFGPVTDLAPIAGSQTSSYTISINVQKKQLLLYFTCPPNADCVPSPLAYYKQ